MNAKVVAQIFGDQLIGRICFLAPSSVHVGAVCRILSVTGVEPIVATGLVLKRSSALGSAETGSEVPVWEHNDLTFAHWNGNTFTL